MPPVQPYLQNSYNTSNVDGCCSWAPVITCDAGARITRLAFANFQDNIIPGSYGTIPTSIANLTNLEILELPRNLHGAFPEAIWQLPNLKALELRDGGVYGTIPNVILAPMQNLTILRQSFTGTIPVSLAEKPTLTRLDLPGNKFECPLPPSIYRDLPGRLPRTILDLSGNAFTVSNGYVCGAFRPEEAGLKILPADSEPAPPPPFNSAGAQHVFLADSFQVEIYNEYIYFFAAKTFPSGRRFVFRDEHIWVNIQGIAYETQSSRFTRNVTAYAVTGYLRQSRTLSPGVFAVDSILANGANLTTILSMEDGSKVKISYELTNISAPIFTQTPGTRPRLELTYRWAVKAPHSTTETPLCSNELLGVLSTSGCVSPGFRYNITFSSEQIVPLLRFEAVTGKVRFNLTFPLDYKIDNDTSGTSLRVLSSDQKKTNLYPVGDYSELASLYAAGLTPSLPSNGLEQHVILVGVFRSNEIPETRLYYDPDVSITLLFDPPESRAEPAVLSPADLQEKAGFNVGLVAGLIVLAVVLVAFVIFAVMYPPLRERIFPFLRKTQPKLTVIEEEQVASQTTPGWTKVSRPSSK